MRKYWKEILLCIIVLLVFVPLIIAFFLSFRLIVTDTSNEWIGFWGGYLGSLFGGLITLYVMQYTIKSTENNLNTERKKNLNDILLNEFIEYHDGVNILAGNILKNEAIDMKEVKKLSVKSKVLTIKLESKKISQDYVYCYEMYKSLTEMTETFNNLVDYRNANGTTASCEIIYNEFKSKQNKFMDNVVRFYSENSL